MYKKLLKQDENSVENGWYMWMVTEKEIKMLLKHGKRCSISKQEKSKLKQHWTTIWQDYKSKWHKGGNLAIMEGNLAIIYQYLQMHLPFDPAVLLGISPVTCVLICSDIYLGNFL